MRQFSRKLSIVLATTIVALHAPYVRAQSPAHREQTADQQVIHSLNRMTFGARPGDVQRIRAIGLDKWVEQQLHPERIDDSDIESFLTRYDLLGKDQNELLIQFTTAQRERRVVAGDSATRLAGRMAGSDMALRQVALSRRQLVGELQSSRVARAVASNRQLQEVMTDFWLNHFNVYAQKGPPQPFYIAQLENDAIRPRALGKFRDLLESVARSPAMLFYLDNARSMADSSQPRLNARGMARVPSGGRKSGLNENYGRELLELHTLGVDGGYTQRDVIEVARAFTGWTIKPPAAGGGFVFRPQVHDAGEKVVLGHRLKSNRGIEDGEEVLDILAKHPATARYVATKLARRFISDNPPPSVVDRAAAVFLRTDGDLREVVRTILTSNEFYLQQSYRAKVKSPFELVVSAVRAMNAKPDSTPRTALAIAYLGQPLFGHQAPNGYPETGEAWMNTGAILNRINFGMSAAANRIPGASVKAIPGLDGVASAARTSQVDAVIAVLLDGSVSPDTRAVLLTGDNPMLDSKGMQAGPMNSPAGEQRQMAQPVSLTGLAQVVGLALGSPEFQRR